MEVIVTLQSVKLMISAAINGLVGSNSFLDAAKPNTCNFLKC